MGFTPVQPREVFIPMALILLIVLGVSLGWLASVIARTEEAGTILRQIAIGLGASLVFGLMTNSGTILGGLTALALGAAVGASALALMAYHMMRSRGFDV